MEKESICLPEKVNTILSMLQQHGQEAYAVGGCVRDAILKRTPQDWDITTSATPAQVKEIFPRTVDTGIEHGTVTVLMNGEGFEVTTYRVDGKYEDSRHPVSVTFTRNLTEDLLRRDFTINAMAYNETSGLVDPYGGRADLERGIIRCVGDPFARFDEDALRILRGVRFAAQLGFEIEEKTREGMKELAPSLAKISAERIQVELVSLITSDRPEYLRVAYELGLTKVFLPEFDRLMVTEQETPHHMYNVGEHTLHAMSEIRPDRILRLTMLLHDMGKPDLKTIDSDGVAHFKKHAERSEVMAREILRRLKFDNDTVQKVTRLVRYHDYRMPATEGNVRRAIRIIGEDLFPDYLEVRRADTLAQSPYLREEKLQNLDDIGRLYKEIVQKGDCVSLKGLAISGRDLLDIGYLPGKEIGDELQKLLDLVIEHPEMNEKETLLKAAEKSN